MAKTGRSGVRSIDDRINALMEQKARKEEEERNEAERVSIKEAYLEKRARCEALEAELKAIREGYKNRFGIKLLAVDKGEE